MISDYDQGLIDGLETAGLLAPSSTENGKWDITPFFRWIIVERPTVAEAVDYSVITNLGLLGVISEESGDWQEEHFNRQLGIAPPAEVINIADYHRPRDEE
jgi:hypothetical protein